jgi:CheY-like chemotaxis protein
MNRGMSVTNADVLVVDDDHFFANFLATLLGDHGGYSVVQAHTVEEALQCAADGRFRLIIMDLKMPPGERFDALQSSGGHKTGVALAREMKHRLPEAKLIIHTGVIDRDLEAWFAGDANVTFLYKLPDSGPLLRKVKAILEPGVHRPLPFIVHGRDTHAVLELKVFLQNRLGFAEPIVLAAMPSGGRTLIEKFEHYAGQADIVFALVTPDDMGCLAEDEAKLKYRARQNVIFEVGYFLGYLRRQSGRIILLHTGNIEIPSDLSGIVDIDVSHGIEASSEQIRREVADFIKLPVGM